MSNFTATCTECGEIVDCTIEWPDDETAAWAGGQAVVAVSPHTCHAPKLEYQGEYIQVAKEELGLEPEKPTGLHDDSINDWWDSNRSD